MTPTPKLRFIERLVPINETTGTRVRILQQWWTLTGTLPEYQDQYGEWRDVPMEKEA